MTKGRRGAIPQRRRIFLGCEGESERSYGRRLFALVEAHHHRVHLEAVLLRPGGGDPLTLLGRAIDHILLQKRTRSGYAHHAVLLDSDLRGLRADRDEEATRLAHRYRIRLIWQDPCHEAFLLRHLEGCDHLRPATVQEARIELARRWPTYQKARTSTQLAGLIDAVAVRRAAAVEPDLAILLDAIDFPRR